MELDNPFKEENVTSSYLEERKKIRFLMKNYNLTEGDALCIVEKNNYDIFIARKNIELKKQLKMKEFYDLCNQQKKLQEK